MSMKPHCPECKTIEKPHSKITGLKGCKVLIVYCSQCGCILGAVEYNPTESVRHPFEETAESTA
jgi:hypothetical protein